MATLQEFYYWYGGQYSIVQKLSVPSGDATGRKNHENIKLTEVVSKIWEESWYWIITITTYLRGEIKCRQHGPFS